MENGYPKLCKDWNRQIVRLKKPICNNGGDYFHFYTGELLLVRHRSKTGKLELSRPRGGINISHEDMEEFITPPLGHEKDLLKIKK